MQRCFDLAIKSHGYTYPNPLVGCVIVCDQKIISEGWHKKAGHDHAEVIGASFSIEDWRAQLLACELDYYASHLLGSYGSLDMYPRNRNKYKYKRKMLDKVNTIMDMQIQSKASPDNAHPGWTQFLPLVENLTAWIRRTNQV